MRPFFAKLKNALSYAKAVGVFAFLFSCLWACSPSQMDSNFHPGIYVSTSNSLISTSSTVVIEGQSITLNATLRDQNFNAYTSNDSTVQFVLTGGTSQGTLSAVSTTGNGTYTVSYTGVSAGTPNQVLVLVNGVPIQSSIPNVQVLSGITLAWTSVPTSSSKLIGGSTQNLTWSMADGSGTFTSLKLYYAADGVNFSPLVTLAVTDTSYTWSVPAATDVNTAVLKLVAIDNINQTLSISSQSFTIDSTPPILSLTSPVGSFLGGSTLDLSLSASDASSGMNQFKLQYASNGSTFVDVTTLSNTANHYLWTLPSDNTVNAKIKIIGTDLAGNSTSLTSTSFTIDSTPPAAPSVSLASSNPTNSTAATLTIASCSDRAKIYVSESSTTPVYSAAGWQTCSTSVGAITDTLTNGDGTKTLYVFAQDAVGNVSTSSTLTTVLDQTLPSAPSLVFGSNGLTSAYKNVSLSTFTSANCTDTSKIFISESATAPTVGSASWQNCSTAANAISYTLTNLTEGSHTLYVWAKDAASNISTTSNTLTLQYDITAPTITSFTLAGGATSIANPTVAITISANDAISGIAQMCLSESGSCSNWLSYSASGTNLDLSQTNGSKTVSLWLKDNAGNISASPSTYNISLDFGSPPTASITSPASSSSYSSGQTVPISWSCSTTSIDGLAAPPISQIQYTADDGITFTTIASNLTNNDTSTTGHYDWTLPVGVSSFRLLVSCKSAAGVVATAYSPSINTSWSIFMGDPWYGTQNVNALIANIGWSKGTLFNNTASSIAGDLSGNIYYVKDSAVMKIDSYTGYVSVLMGDVNTAGCGTGSVPTGQYLNQPFIIGTNANHDSILVLSRNCNKIYSISTADSSLTLWATLPSTVAGGNFFLTKNRTFLFFDLNSNLFKLNLAIQGQNPIQILGNSTCGTVTGRYAVGTVVTGLPIQYTSTSTYVCPNNDSTLAANDDATQILINPYNDGNAYRIDYVSGQYQIGQSDYGSFLTSTIQNCIRSDSDAYIYCTRRDLSNSGRIITPINPSTWVRGTSWTLPFDQNDNSGNLRVGVGYDRIFASYSLNGIFSIIPNVASGTWSSTRIAGQYLATMGNGNTPTLVGFDNPTDIKYSSSNQQLWVRNASGHIRKIDLSVSPYNTSTLFNSQLIQYDSKDVSFIPSLAGSGFIMQYSCGRNDLYKFTVSGSTLSQANSFLYGPCNNTVGNSYPPATGDSAGNSGTTTIFQTLLGYSNWAYHQNGNAYFAAVSSAQNAFIFMSDTNTLTRIAGKTGAAGYSSSDNGALALGAQLTNVKMIQEISSGLYAHDLLILDNDRLRRVSVSTEAATPRIYDIASLTLAGAYSSGTTFYDFYYDQSTEQSSVLGTGTIYYVKNNNTVHKWVPNAALTSATDTTYSFTGTSFSGIVRITLTPSGLLVLQPNKARILRIAP